MNKSLKISIFALTGVGLAGGTMAFVGDDGTPTREQLRAERLLEGKVAGEPQQCIQLRRIRHTTVVDPSTILYRVNSRELYRTDLGTPCGGMDNDSTLITTQPSAQLCAGDQIRVVENPTGREQGLCAVGEFVPYRTASR